MNSFYTEILTIKADLQHFFISEKLCKSTGTYSSQNDVGAERNFLQRCNCSKRKQDI